MTSNDMNLDFTHEVRQLTAEDGHLFNVDVFNIGDHCKGSIVLLQEIFGITENILHQAKSFCGRGYQVLVPHIFDRIQPHTIIDYENATAALETAQSIPIEQIRMDISSAVNSAKSKGPVSVVGFCWGGSLAFLSANWFEIDCAVAYYGSRIKRFLNREPGSEVLFHFGDQDPSITADDVKQIAETFPKLPIFIYPGSGHAFANQDRPSYVSNSANSAFERTVSFLDDHMALSDNESHED